MAMITIRQERSTDIPARERLLDAAFGPARLVKTSERLREGRFAADDLSFVAIESGRLVGTARLWSIVAGLGRLALLLGPVAVAEDTRRRGIGAMLVKRALAEAKRLGHRAVLLVGDASYYGGFGFTADATAAYACRGRSSPNAFSDWRWFPPHSPARVALSALLVSGCRKVCPRSSPASCPPGSRCPMPPDL
jgi:predicted N-acetyltransferase YhbS